jgi:autotransporter-associated beta strand protein
LRVVEFTLLAILIAVPDSAQALTKTWDAGGATGNAGDLINWNTDGIPGAADDVLFDNSGQSPLEDIFLGAAPTVNSATINLTAGSNQSWNLGAATNASPFTLTLATGNISVLSTSGTGTYVLGATSGALIGAGILTLVTSATGFTFNDSRTNGGLLQINAVVSGTAKNVTKLGAGTVVLSGVNTYTGVTTLGAGTLSVSTIGNGSAAGNLGKATQAAANFIFDGGELDYTGLTDSTNRNFTINTGKTATFDIVTNTLTISGASTATNGALAKLGTGTLILSGVNLYTGATTISGGTLTAAAPSASAALGSTSAITVNSGGTLLLGNNNQINNVAAITLAGGTFAKGNFSEGSTSTAGVGALTLTATGSRLDFGTGTVGTLTFASFAPGGRILTIDNWTGTASTLGTGSTDRLIFDSDQSANLSSFNFTGFASGATEFNLGSGFFEITPVLAAPEPATYVVGLLTLLVIAFQRRKILRRLLS